MPNFRLFRRNNQTSTCLQAPVSQSELLTSISPVTTTNNAFLSPQDNRHKKIIDFYNRKTRRGAPVSLTDFTPSPETTRIQRSQSDITSFNDSNMPNTQHLVPYPSNNSAEDRSTWALRHARISESSQTSHANPVINGGQPGSNDRNNNEPINSFVILQPFFVEFQNLGLNQPPHAPHDHPTISQSFSLPNTFPPFNPIDESLLINQLTLLENTHHADNNFVLSLFENEIEDAYDPGDDEDVEAPEIFGDDTTCTICSGIFRDPRILTCGHTFCLKCLVQMHRHTRQRVLVCPICREQTIVYSNDLKYLTKNFVVKNLVETIKISTKNGKYLKSQLEESFKNETQNNDNNKCSTIELKETKSFPLKEGRVHGIAMMKQKIYLVYERSNHLHIVTTKTFLMGTPKRDETILLDGVSNPLDLTSKEDKNVLFLLDSLNSNNGIHKSIVWKVLLPNGKHVRSLKIVKWMDGLQTGANIINAFDGLMIMMLVFENGRYSVNFYLSENEFGELARQIHLNESVIRPVQISKILDESEIAISHHDGKTWNISVINLEGKALRNVTFEANDRISNLISNEKTLFFMENNKNQILKMDRDLKEKSLLEIKKCVQKTITKLHAVDQKKFIVCTDGQMSICEV